jgi:predicted transposase YbfD/YdcC
VKQLKVIEAQKLQEIFLMYFDSIEDPRVQGRCEHKLIDIIAIAACAVLCGAESFVEIEEFGIQRENWLRSLLELPSGIPSHDTFARVLSLLDSEALEKAFTEWAKDIQLELIEGSTSRRLSLDGKSVKGTERQFNASTRPLVLVNVYCHESGLSLGQKQAPSSGNAEVAPALECLDALNLEGTLVSADAGLGRPAVVKKIRSKKGHYLVPIKANSRCYFDEVEGLFSRTKRYAKRGSQEEQSHGRLEQRKVKIIDSPLKKLTHEFAERFPDAKVLIAITRSRSVKDLRYSIGYKQNPNHQKMREERFETVYYISSKKMNAAQAFREIREHWAIENQLHWGLDVTFLEDSARVRHKIAARNLALLRKMAFNLIQKCPEKGSRRVKMKRAAWNEAYLEKLLGVSSAHF